MKEINKAFSSLSFRGNRGYSSKLMKKDSKHSISQRTRATTYGAILRIKIDNADLYALVQGRYTGKWSFPKGHSNEGESAIDCTMREVGEETGIDKLPEPIEYLQIGYGNYFVFNLKEPVPLIPRDTHEIIDTKWVTLEEMENMSLNADASLYRKQMIGVKSVSK
jgi:8-oxo-dGTP pyrophosphatase MutT (NUDIX family)